MTKKIPLSHGRFAIVDDEDFETVGQMRWDVTQGYAWCRSDGNNTSLQNLIMKPPEGMVVDHINHNRLDCRRCNLRVCTHHQNAMNKRRIKPNTRSIYKGVNRNIVKGRPYSKWIARICYKGKVYYQGKFKTQEEAAHWYDTKAKELFGEYASLNFPE